MGVDFSPCLLHDPFNHEGSSHCIFTSYVDLLKCSCAFQTLSITEWIVNISYIRHIR